MGRPGLAAGILPTREGLEGELLALRSVAACAKRTFEQYRNHSNELAWWSADQAVHDFLIAHPELADKP